MSYVNYRAIWESFNGPIPKDDRGRTFEIHHKDGDRSNNEISNLECLSIDHHYNIHLDQEDYMACYMIMLRMDDLVGVESDLSETSKASADKRVKDGTHNFLKENRNTRWGFTSEKASIINDKRLKDGTHNFLSEGHQQKVKQTQLNLILQGSHHFQQQDNSCLGRKSFDKRLSMWVGLGDIEFLTLISKYKFWIKRKLRNGVVSREVNKMIIQALNARYGDNEDVSVMMFNKIKEINNVDEACMFPKKQDKDKWGRLRKRST